MYDKLSVMNKQNYFMQNNNNNSKYEVRVVEFLTFNIFYMKCIPSFELKSSLSPLPKKNVIIDDRF